MSISIRHKIDNRRLAGTYKYWIDEIVDKGIADQFLILRYPDIVQLQTIDAFGKKSNDKLMERISAKQLKNKHPEAYDFIEIDIKKQIQNDIKRSIKAKNQSSKSSKTKYRIRIKPMINAIKTLNPVWKFIISIIAMIVGGFLTYLIIEWYKTLSYV
ncbi:hypothetical protein [Draconibacterium orientale]|uniref:hypothetical protein n=1 Tax=Draconibacterium orientale TaxID=1168034 RepID=UPI002ABD3839|nr:hypothetical protein [Draconibacterium orientale]